MDNDASRPPLVSRFSDDSDAASTSQGSEGLIGVARGKVRNIGLSDLLANERNEISDNNSMAKAVSRRSKSPPTIIRRITSKLRLASPTTTSTPPFPPRSTRPEEISQEGVMLSPRPSDDQGQDSYFPSRQNSGEYLYGRERGTGSFVVMGGRGLKSPSEVDTRLIEGYPSGPIYPHTLHDPQFCKSRSTSDLRRPSTSVAGLQAVSERTISGDAVPVQWPSSTPDFSRAACRLEHARRRSSSSLSSPPLSPSAVRHPRAPTRTLPPIPTEAIYSTHSSSSSASSSRDSWATADPLTTTSPRTSIASKHTSTSSRRRVSIDSPQRKSAEETIRDLGIPTHHVIVEKTPQFVAIPVISESISVQVENVGSELAAVSFPTMHADGEVAVAESGPPRMSHEHSKSLATDTSSRSENRQRRKSFVGQSLDNLRKSFSRVKPKAPPVPPLVS